MDEAELYEEEVECGHWPTPSWERLKPHVRSVSCSQAVL